VILAARAAERGWVTAKDDDLGLGFFDGEEDRRPPRLVVEHAMLGLPHHPAPCNENVSRALPAMWNQSQRPILYV